MSLELVDARGAPILPRIITHWGDGTTALTNRDISLDLKVLSDLKKNAGNSDAIDPETANVLEALGLAMRYNGATGKWERARNNEELTILVSAARTATTASPDQVNYNARIAVVFFRVSAAPGVETVTMALEIKDPVSGLYVQAFTDSAWTGPGMRSYCLGVPLATASQPLNGGSASPPSRTWRVNISHSGAGSWTYSVAGCYIN